MTPMLLAKKGSGILNYSSKSFLILCTARCLQNLGTFYPWTFLISFMLNKLAQTDIF